jgi:hypothetical protein
VIAAGPVKGNVFRLEGVEGVEQAGTKLVALTLRTAGLEPSPLDLFRLGRRNAVACVSGLDA